MTMEEKEVRRRICLVELTYLTASRKLKGFVLRQLLNSMSFWGWGRGVGKRLTAFRDWSACLFVGHSRIFQSSWLVLSLYI